MYIGLSDYFAVQILQGLMLRHREPGYSDKSAIVEAIHLAEWMVENKEEIRENYRKQNADKHTQTSSDT